ncbi:MAG: phenylalanine--tRNA ligase subunit alpha [Elusimicrobiota bacterium]
MDIKAIEQAALADLEKVSNLKDLEVISIKYLGRKEGELTKILRQLGSLSPEEKKQLGQSANELRVLLESKVSEKQKELESHALLESLSKDKLDLSLPGVPIIRGSSHPILKAIQEISAIFQQLGFDSVEGPEIENDSNNFTDLNIPLDHPARDMHDTFYLEKEIGSLLLRTHTSPVQIRVMKTNKPPIRIISPGRVFRNEATDATHAAVFHQIEGLYVAEKVSFADLKGTLTYFAQKYFGSQTKVRFLPSYFPFVEPGAQMDVSCFACAGNKVLPSGENCSLCKATGWIEMLGAGMVHPQVLKNVGYDPKKVSGFAFGMGVERIVMTRYKVRDIRLFLDSDLRFLEQFK